MGKKTIVILTSIAVIGALFWGFSQYRSRAELENLLNARYQQAFFSLLEHVEQSQVLLAKNLLTTSPENRVQLLSDVWYEANAAQASLSTLPVSQPFLNNTTKFLTQVGAYSQSLLGQTTLGKPLQSNQVDALTNFHNNMTMLSSQLQKIRRQLNEGSLTWQKLKTQTQDKLPSDTSEKDDETFRSINQEIMLNQPILIYDGPFSDHLNLRQPKGISGDMITTQEAQRVLKQFADLPTQKGNWRVQSPANSQPGGKIPAYAVSLTGENMRIFGDVTKQGGQVIWLTVERKFQQPKLSLADAKKVALDFISTRGFENFAVSFATIQSNTATVSLVPVENKAWVYPDQIKLELALDNGQVVGFNALNYLMSHHQRQFPQLTVSREEAVAKLNESFQVLGARLALIPLASGKEVLTWEFRGKFHQDTFYVYINAVTGKEEQIFQVISNDQGQLAM